jgi:hypothetical protein
MNLLPKAQGITPLTPAAAEGMTRHGWLAAISRPDFLTIVAFCVIGLLVTVNVILRFPDFGALIEQYNQF